MDLDDDPVCTPADNPELSRLLDAPLSRRRVLQGALGTAAVTFLGGPRALLAQSAARLGVTSVPVAQEDGVLLPDGYESRVVMAWGDPVSNGPAWDPSAANSAAEQAVQMGMHADGLHFFPLPFRSQRSRRALR